MARCSAGSRPLLAVFTAYVRVLGGSLGLTQHFAGPMAKQHRMFTLTLTTLLAAIETSLGWPPRAMVVGLADHCGGVARDRGAPDLRGFSTRRSAQ